MKYDEAGIAKWREERNAALRSLDLDYMRKALPHAPDKEVLLMAMHKARYECTDLDAEQRHTSAQWLRERGLGARTGPLLPEGELPR